MIQIAGIGEELICAAMKHFDVAEGEEKTIYAERLRATVETVIEMSRQPEIIFNESGITIKPESGITIKPLGDNKTMEEDENKGDKAPDGIRRTKRQQEILTIKGWLKAGKDAGWIAKETGRPVKDVVEDINSIRMAEAK